MIAIAQYCQELLKPEEFDDASYNGLQVEGRDDVHRVAWTVTASAACLNKAATLQADLVCAHHGIFWKGQSPLVRGGMRKRLQVLLEHNMNLLAYHLPLDAHQTLGNNAVMAQRLGLVDRTAWGRYHGRTIGAAGRFPQPRPVKEVEQLIEHLVGRSVLHLEGGPTAIERVALVSGSAASMALEAARDGFDLFLTGEPSEAATHVAAEEGIHIIAAGHHATEVFGVRALAEHLGAHFDLEILSCDIPGPV
ncbi:MAG: Nif3-like dinuclear metal center hexameric protein [Deltaproteobacteria bacterium]|nr:Nif3-like dinuclear metal center hexameric protein [Deltaproteobacteria bacterium]